ncbi:MAG: cache domain-containing protein, partial [Methanoregulaceae archaeon]|nr:cache domain-containing protein [Methanoregulaceae archaeon]
MMGLVQNAAEFGKQYDRNTSFAEISNRSGQFVDASGHYVYAYDYNGTLLAHPYLPDLVGTSLIGRRDAFGMENIRALCETAQSGGGYVIFIWPNPDAGNKEELKIGYVLPVDDTWWVGSGAYLDEITGVYSFYPPHPV